MNRRIANVLGAVCLTAVSSAGWAQSTQTTQQPQPATQPQQQTTQAAVPGQAAQSQAGPAAASQSSSGAPDKKVWTNEDVGDLRDHSPISTIGNPDPKGAKPAAKSPPAKGKNARWYVDQIQALQAKIPALNDKIQQLQAALNGDQVNSTRQYGGVRPDDWKDQLQRLQKQRDDLQEKIAALEDQARHDGVAPNLLPQQ